MHPLGPTMKHAQIACLVLHFVSPPEQLQHVQHNRSLPRCRLSVRKDLDIYLPT